MAISVVLLALMLAACGDSPSSKSAEGNRQASDFALAREVCEEGAKSDFAVESVGLPADASDPAIARGYAAQWPRHDRKPALAGCLKGLASAPARFPASSRSARAIWGRTFTATSIARRQAGREPPIIRPLRIRLWFSSEPRHSISWTARCNSYSGDVRIAAHRIKVDVTFTTLVGCPSTDGKEDSWLAGFISANPKWTLKGKDLKLTTNRAIIELKIRTNPVSPTRSRSSDRSDSRPPPSTDTGRRPRRPATSPAI
jgi:heat shock protein HslJ